MPRIEAVGAGRAWSSVAVGQPGERAEEAAWLHPARPGRSVANRCTAHRAPRISVASALAAHEVRGVRVAVPAAGRPKPSRFRPAVLAVLWFP